ncbi:unnamed protein product [Staurois parvus]|uniref:Uncharacterized protein n=1 Tax=Staurois parvus TaxID=386267 RepID=A0ABN9H7C7_9NEOB|nr:unnamed protein product [Staurois parvus]
MALGMKGLTCGAIKGLTVCWLTVCCVCFTVCCVFVLHCKLTGERTVFSPPPPPRDAQQSPGACL